jgi:hypothetical protein
LRIVIAMLSVVAMLGLVSTGAAAPAKTTPIDAVLAGNGCGVTGLECGTGGGGSCLCEAAFWNFAGRANIPRLGRLDVTGRYEDGFFCSDIGDDLSCAVPLTYTRSLTLTLTAPNGDTLVLDEDFASTTRPLLLSGGDNPVQGHWTVDPDQSTGRFAGDTGSGTYTLGDQGQSDHATFTIALTGSLTSQ